MSIKDVLLHLRFPFSLFLMPIFWLAISQQAEPNISNNVLIFIVLHFFVYPASNAFNSYFDKDEGSIGGLKSPPKVDVKLYNTANLFDLLGAVLALFVSLPFAICVLGYVLVSRMYSHPSIRLKKRAILSWLIVGLFQGALVFSMVYFFGQNTSLWASTFLSSQANSLLGLLFAAFILWSAYPLTQVYQHKEDAANGDHTISLKLGIVGTFIFSAILFVFAGILAYLYLPTKHFLSFLVFTSPLSIYLGWWFSRVLKDKSEANFENTMRLNLLSSLLLNACFIINNWIF